MDQETREAINQIINRQDSTDRKVERLEQRQDKFEDCQKADHDSITEIKADTNYIKGAVDKINSKWENWDSNNFNQLDKWKWGIFGIVFTVVGGLILTYLTHNLIK